MSVRHDVEFYIRTDRSRVVEAAAETSLPSLVEILDVPDVYVRYFLLTNVDVPVVEDDGEVLRKLKGFFHEFLCSDPVAEVDFSRNMLGLVARKVRITSMEEFICCISELDFSSVDLEYYRKFFGYSQIYSLYKSMIKRVFSCRFNHREIGLVMLLLDNETLCFRKLLPIFSRLTKYVKDNIIDKNIVACCIVLRSVLTYIPGTMCGKDEYVMSLLSYLVGIVSQHVSFVFINEKDADEIISTIEVLTGYGFDTDVGKVALGAFIETMFNLETLLQSRTAIYEEIFAVVCMLEVVPVVYRLFRRFSSMEYDFSNAYNTIQEAGICRMSHVGEGEWSHISDKFLVAKFKSLDELHREGGGLFNRVTFYNEISKAKHPSRILRVVDNMKDDVSWGDIIVLACSPHGQEEYLRFLFDDFFMHKAEHLAYVALFIDSIGDRPDLLLYSGYLLLRSPESPGVEKRWELLADLYVRHVGSGDQRLIRLGCIISDHVCGMESSEQRCLFMKILVGKLNDRFTSFDSGVISFLHLYLMDGTRQSPGTSQLIASYLTRCVASEAVEDSSRKFHELEAVYVSVAARALILSEGHVPPSHPGMLLDTYYDLLACCVAWREGRLSQEYFDTVRNKMFDFLFDAEKRQTYELGLLVRGKASRFTSKFNELYRDSGTNDTGM